MAISVQDDKKDNLMCDVNLTSCTGRLLINMIYTIQSKYMVWILSIFTPIKQ